MRKHVIFRWGGHAPVASVIALVLPMVPSKAAAQTVLPDITVIAPTPLSGHRAAKPSAGTAAPATSAPSRAPSPGTPATGSAGPADLASIDRDKVPSNTTVLMPT